MAASVPLPWKTTLFGTLLDYDMLLTTIVCPALAYYSTSKHFQTSPAGCLESIVGGYCPCYGWTLRRRLRQKYDLDGSILEDILVHLCCHCVALTRIWEEAESQAKAKNQEMQSMEANTSSSPDNQPSPSGHSNASLTQQRVEPDAEVMPCALLQRQSLVSECLFVNSLRPVSSEMDQIQTSNRSIPSQIHNCRNRSSSPRSFSVEGYDVSKCVYRNGRCISETSAERRSEMRRCCAETGRPAIMSRRFTLFCV